MGQLRVLWPSTLHLGPPFQWTEQVDVKVSHTPRAPPCANCTIDLAIGLPCGPLPSVNIEVRIASPHANSILILLHNM